MVDDGGGVDVFGSVVGDRKKFGEEADGKSTI